MFISTVVLGTIIIVVEVKSSDIGKKINYNKSPFIIIPHSLYSASSFPIFF